MIQNCLIKLAFVIISLLPTTAIVVAQQATSDTPVDPEFNWLGELGLFQDARLLNRFDRYTREDIEVFKRRVVDIRDGEETGWRGNYFYDFSDSVTYSRLTWNAKGFFQFSVYTCLPELRTLKYGRTKADQESVTLIIEDAKAGVTAEERFVKVRWEHRRYLVAEGSLAAFAEKAAGRYVEPDNPDDEGYQLWANYWMKSDKEDDPQPDGLPALPSTYKHLERKPLFARIAAVGRRELRPNVAFGNQIFTAESAVYPVFLSAGSKSGLAVGMTLINKKTGEEVFVEKASSNTSRGILVRPIDNDRTDHCLSDQGDKVACPRLVTGTLLSTKSGSFWW